MPEINPQTQGQLILESWEANAQPWTRAVRNSEIASRKLVTNAAIVRQVLNTQASSVWDVGCGEGWLSLHLQQHGITCFGTDAIQNLVDAAQAGGLTHTGSFTYEDIIAGNIQMPFNPTLAVFNFSLFEAEQAGLLLQAVAHRLQTPRRIIIQTLHPFAAAPETYESQWREGSWQGFSEAFTKPFPWFYRTMSSWLELLHRHKFVLEEMVEPLHPDTGQPASLILQATCSV